ncbi:putative reverse transcriptase zinc-binding domain-containing protein [Medicago truncatula]|uniref:Putative reverse transcriptase zinc-binding domain-containing protein n=1 Tax=Medicago truncatula TaxID=3880 RepID=A0A396IB75_MEDTR|nr:putative reverse transcriptase zinc-binding domain-containing protein [Medicago truncatula]
MNEIVDNIHLHKSGRWDLIWNIKSPPKIKNLLWRVSGLFRFPTRAQRSSRGVSCPTECVICRNNYEDIIHVLLECLSAVQVWHAVNLWDKIDRQQLTPIQSENFAAILWSLWEHRNLKLWQQTNETNVQVIERAK